MHERRDIANSSLVTEVFGRWPAFHDAEVRSVLTQVLAQNDLVDEYNLHVYPLVLGGGKRLYPEGKRLDLTLVEASPLSTGVVFMRYRHLA